MKKWTKRLSVSGAVLLGTLIVVVLICVILLRGTPDWYQPSVMSAEQRAAAAQRATNKIAIMQNQAARVRADEHADTQGGKSPSTTSRPANAITISFSDEEINALIEDWTKLPDVRQVYERFMTEPRVAIQDGNVILAGKVKDLSAVASLHFEPKIDAEGMLSLKLVKILAGKLRLPAAVFGAYEEKLTKGIATRQPNWRRQADIDPTGLANSAAISAEMSDLVLAVLDDEPADPVLFLRQSPLNSASIPVKISEVTVEDHSITMIVAPMTPDQRATLLKRIREPNADQAAAQ